MDIWYSQSLTKRRCNVEPTGEEQPENLFTPKESSRHENDIPKTAAEMEMVDINLPFLYFNV